MRPYKDLEITDKYIIREFDENIDPIELMWHRDDEDRVVEIIEPGTGWKFQFENELPWDLEPNILRQLTSNCCMVSQFTI